MVVIFYCESVNLDVVHLELHTPKNDKKIRKILHVLRKSILQTVNYTPPPSLKVRARTTLYSRT